MRVEVGVVVVEGPHSDEAVTTTKTEEEDEMG